MNGSNSKLPPASAGAANPPAELVSIIMPTYNGEKYLGEAVASVVAQTHPHWELLIVDDGSVDGSLDIAREWSGRDSRIKVLQHPGGVNRGLSASRNLAISQATGEWLALLDCDDIWTADKLERQMDCLTSNPDAVLCYDNSLYIDERGEDVPEGVAEWLYTGGHGRGPNSLFQPTISAILKEDVVMHASTAVFRKAAALKYGGFYERFRGGGEDICMWCCLALEGPFVHIDEALARYRIHADQWMNNQWRYIGKETQILLCRWLLSLNLAPADRQVVSQVLLKNFNSQLGVQTGFACWNPRSIATSFMEIMRDRSVGLKSKVLAVGLTLRRMAFLPLRGTNLLWQQLRLNRHRP